MLSLAFSTSLSIIPHLLELISIYLGDIVPANFYNNSTWYDALVEQSSKPFYTVIGNHDVGNSADISKAGTMSQVVEKYIFPNEEKMGKTGLQEPYYSFSIMDHKLYFIVLYNYDSPDDVDANGEYVVFHGAECYGQKQIDWFIDELNRIPEDYSLVIFRHSYYERNTRFECNFSQLNSVLDGNERYCYGTKDIIPAIVNAWKNGIELNEYISPERDYEGFLNPLTISADFTERGEGQFICYLVGHTHKDVVAHSSSYPDQLIIGFAATASDKWQNEAADLPRVYGTKSYDAITVVSFDTDAKCVNLVRIGSNISNRMIDRTMISLAYE